MKAKGYREQTLRKYSRDLKQIAKHVNLDDPEMVKLYIARKNCRDSYKEKLVSEYDQYLKWRGISWSKPIYRRDTMLPFIPLEKEIDQLIAASRGKISIFLQFVKESACRPIEAWSVKWKDVDFERNLIYINDPAKHSKPRVFKPSSQLIRMIRRLPRKSDYLFREHNDSKLKNFERTFYLLRKRVALKLQNPRLLRISFRTLRHWKATVEYRKTKDILHVMNLLGHKNIKNTLVYTHLVKFEGEDEWICKTAKTVEEACKLVEAGFEYVCELNGVKIFRKRK